MICTDQWAARLPPHVTADLVSLRYWPDIQIAIAKNCVWIRGRFDHKPDSEFNNQRLETQLRCLLGCERYHVLADGQLVPMHRQVPTNRLPQLDWMPLNEAIAFQRPSPRFVGRSSQCVELRLECGSSRYCCSHTEPELLICNLAHWFQFVDIAAQIRLERLTFACNSHAQVVVRGQPLPPIAGQRFLLFDCIAVPVGWHWQPIVTPETLKDCFSISPRSIAVWFADNTWQEVGGERFLPARRASVRMTFAQFQSGLES